MRDNRFFVKSTDPRGLVAVRVGDSPSHSRYGEVVGRIEALCGREAAALFAEPVTPRGGDSGEAVIAWYTSLEGRAVELAALEEGDRRPVQQRLEALLAALEPARRDTEIGQVVNAWLNIPTPNDVLVIDRTPVLVNWGRLPAEIGSTTEDRQAHYQRTLGRFVGLPVAASSARVASAARVVDGLPPSAAAGSPANVTGVDDRRERDAATGNAGATATPLPVHHRPWLAPLVASLVAGGLLLLLLQPGVLLYPSAAPAVADDFERRRIEASNESLEAQLRVLRERAQDSVCRADTLDRAAVPDLARVDGAERADGQPPPQMELVPRPPQDVTVPPAVTGSPEVGTIAAQLDKAAVLVIGLKSESETSQGSGFFISDRHIVTNRHVVEGVRPGLLFVASQAIAGIRKGKLLAMSEPELSTRDVLPDFAVIEIAPVSGTVALALATTPAKLSTAYVAGFPGFLTRRDDKFQALLRELAGSLDSGATAETLSRQQVSVPGADLRHGRINNIMNSGSRSLRIVVHDMQLAPGNSGGPLLDACGRLGGINTLLFTPEEGGQQGNIALDVSHVRAFLTEHGIPFQSADGPCAPQPVAAAAAPPQPTVQSPTEPPPAAPPTPSPAAPPSVPTPNASPPASSAKP